ncbi:hypothetical protein [Halalkalibacter krulwichiae]|uniref:IDEAL domain-containing protein n=1 Tax=Halalkalibacter krulwichiae TaxID=199441 RepID=A0A1X9MAT4_9BACI|nr:hypothetical protein [Halalkalibacter krulwichiae]ARK30536.1 hypothetical protein BkAM31D_12235 [Halalkalibacter krulwichiae]
MSFFARFSNIDLEVNLSMIHTFVKKIKETYSYKWIRKMDQRSLIIYGGEKSYELPFQERETKIYLTVTELTTSEKPLALLLNQFLFEARKKKLGIKNLKEKSKALNKEPSPITTKPVTLQKSQVSHFNNYLFNKQVIQMEIDYLLMDLYDAMQLQDEEKVKHCKLQLQEIVSKQTEE